jgi:hypothetical protein
LLPSCFAGPLLPKGRRLRALAYNTTNGQVVYGGTNDLTFTNSVYAPQFFVKIGTNIFVSIADDVAEFFVPIDVRSSNGILFGATNSAAATRTNLGLGSGITTNVTFVDAATNTNSVTISNGIITDWTQ